MINTGDFLVCKLGNKFNFPRDYYTDKVQTIIHVDDNVENSELNQSENAFSSKLRGRQCQYISFKFRWPQYQTIALLSPQSPSEIGQGICSK